MSVERYNRAMAAYLAIMAEPKPQGEKGWTPPPSTDYRDKKWSKRLREIWPDYCAVRMADQREKVVAERRVWCNTQAQYYWTSGNGIMFYFSDRATALLFKLTFGGTVE